MQNLLRLLAVSAALMIAAPALSRDDNPNERVYEQGSVWTVSYVRTNPGKFNAYIKDLSLVWRAFLEDSKKDGGVLSYKILSSFFTRDDEPDLILLVEFKDMATFDRSAEYFEAQAKKILGSLDDTRSANINREELRTLRGTMVTRELIFTN